MPVQESEPGGAWRFLVEPGRQPGAEMALMKRLPYLLSAVLAAAILASGCGTIQTVSSGELSPYAGTELDLWIAEHYDGDRVLAALDSPVSFVFDSILFPLYVVTLTDAEGR